MKLSKKLTAIFAPIASVSIVAPIATSCGGKTYEINFADNINCNYSKTEGYTKIAPFKTKDEVYKAAEVLCDQEPSGQVALTDANNDRTLQSVYADFVASMSSPDSQYEKFFLDVLLSEDKTKFEYFLLTDPEGDSWLAVDVTGLDNAFKYVADTDTTHIDILFTPGFQTPISDIKVRSHRYYNCTIKNP